MDRAITKARWPGLWGSHLGGVTVVEPADHEAADAAGMP
jgi:hypothetical protein